MFNLLGWMAIGSIFAVVCFGIGCLRSCEGKLRICLFWDTVVFLTALALHFGGYIVLGFLGLSWRNQPGAVLWMVLVGSFLVWIILALYGFLSRNDWIGWFNKGVVTLVAAAAFLGVLWLGLIVLAFGYGKTEQVLEYQGKTLVWEYDPFTSYYYEYHGPLVCGSKGFYNLDDAVK